jgi:Fur family ferric uptake transcriptional regulator
VDQEQMERFRDFLVERGLKFTRQREAIALVLFESGSHLSLTELLDLARERQPSVGYATVYRTMKLMSESGLASEHRFADVDPATARRLPATGEGGRPGRPTPRLHARYEVAHEGEHHDHLICVRCGRIFEYEDDEIERRQEEMASRRGFRVVSHRHEIYGECLRDPCPDRISSGEMSGRS